MRPPDFAYHQTRARILPLPPVGQRACPDHDATLGHWLIHAPWAHLCWSHYNLTLIHLRDLPGVRPARKQYPLAEYELMLWALNPDHTPDVEGGPLHLLQPANLIYQFHGVSDEQAVAVAVAFLKAVVAERLSPDTDFHRLQVDGLDATVEHYRQGLHSPQ